MKKIISSLAIAFLLPAILFAQAPQSFNYQAVARDASGKPLVGQTVSARISILNTFGGAAIYQETQPSLSTNQFGLFTLAIGAGNPVIGTFSSIDWTSGTKFIKIEFDPAGGTSYLDMGTTQLLSVPFALYAQNSGSGGGGSLTLPYTNTVNSASNLFSLTNSGTGAAGNFNNSDNTSTTNALTGQTSGTGYGVYGINNHASAKGVFGVYGTYNNQSHGAGVAGIGTKGTITDLTSSSFNVGVYGSADSIAVLGDAPGGNGSVGVYGTSDYVGTWGSNFSSAIGKRTNLYDATAIGGYFNSGGGEGSYSVSTGEDLFGTNHVSNGAVNLALSSNADFNVGTLTFGFGLGNTGSATGIQAYAQGTAQDIIGVYATTLSSGTTATFAGYFDGDVNVTGNLSKGAGSFKIDHPLDPANKYLYHSFVESPDMMNIYNGNITTDTNGDATIALPDYFETLNKDFRYQLTVIGSFAQAMVAEKVQNNQFKIKTNQPNTEVSWQVTGIRQDPYANAHRIVPEVEKKGNEKGKYLYPELYGKGYEQSITSLISPVGLRTAYQKPNLPKTGLKLVSQQ